jgi:type IV secretory pathway protease TraF
VKHLAVITRRIALVQIALTVGLLGVLVTANMLELTGNASPSEPRGIYRLTHEPLTRGAFVVLKMPLKQIAGLPGDTIRVTPYGSYVNGELWPDSGIPAAATNHFAYGTYVLQPGQLWVLGNHPLSYDSRYLGMIPEALVNATARPLFTTEAKR